MPPDVVTIRNGYAAVEILAVLKDQSLKTLADYSSPGLMVPELQTHTAAGVIGELCLVLQQQRRLSDLAAFHDAVMNRESLSPTSISPGWALPHARLKELRQLSLALGRSSEPLRWFGDRAFGVRIVFLFAVPEAEGRTYLNLIAAVARLSQDSVLLERLMHAPDARAMFEVLERVALLRHARGPVIAGQ